MQISLAFLPTAGIEPAPPAQQVSALSITPLPLGNNHELKPPRVVSFFPSLSIPMCLRTDPLAEVQHD